MTTRHKKTVMKRYNTAVKTYNSLYEAEQKAKYGMIIPQLQFSEEDIVLDLGCGTGLLVPMVASKAGRVVGIDISINMLGLAKKMCLYLKNTSLVLADAEFLPIRDHAFSKIFAFTLLQNIPCKTRTLAEIKRTGSCQSEKIITLLKKGDEKKTLKELPEYFHQIISTVDSPQLKDIVVVCR